MLNCCVVTEEIINTRVIQIVRVFNKEGLYPLFPVKDYKKGTNFSLHYTATVHFISIEHGVLWLTHSSNPKKNRTENYRVS